MATDYINKEQIWGRVLGEIELMMSKANFITWFQNTNIAKIEKGVLFLNVPNSFTKEWIKNKYNKPIIGSLRRIDPSIRTIEYVICSNPIKNLGNTIKYNPLTQKEKQNNNEQQMGFKDFNSNNEEKSSLNPRYTFDNFIVGSFNELAHAASLAVSKNPGITYNPLFIYGGVGLGKTHLLQSVGNKIKENNPNFKIKYTTCEKFSNKLVFAMQNNTIYKLKEEYKQYDLLIIDDVQFLSGKNKMQEELFHIFNTLYENNKQIIFSSDRPPKAIENLEERLRSRFAGGMMADVSEPEYEARLAILKSKIHLKNLDLSDDILDYIATSIKNNIRELEGALNLLFAKTKLLGRDLSEEELIDIFNKNIAQSNKKITFNKIIKTITTFYDIEEQSLFEKSRRKEFVLPRQITMYLLREDFKASYPYIGQKLGGRDHTTVMHAYEKISKDLKINKQIKDDIKIIREQIYM